MGTMYMGFHYDMCLGGIGGWRVTAPSLTFSHVKKASIPQLKRQLIANGVAKDDIEVEKDDD